MARKLRQNPHGPWHHVTNRGARCQAIFLDDVDRENFLHVLSMTCKRFDVEVHAYCLMGDHYHLLLRCTQGNISEVVKYLASVYTQHFNRRHGFDGALFKGRFVSVPTESDEQLLTTSRYIHLNPLDINGVTETNLHDYPWSSLGAFLDPTRSRPSWLVTHFTLSLGNLGVAGYQAFMGETSNKVVSDESETAQGAPDASMTDESRPDDGRYAALASSKSITVTVQTSPSEPRGSPEIPP